MYIIETKALFLLILAVMGNFIAETLGCKTQKLLSENMFCKHFIIFFIVFYSMSVFNDTPQNPKDVFIKSLQIYIGFILFAKMNLFFVIIVFLLLALQYVLQMYMDYYKLNNDSNTNDEIIKKLNSTINYINSFIIILILVGFILYFKKQYKDYYKNWSTMKFIFGVNKCKSLN